MTLIAAVSDHLAIVHHFDGSRILVTVQTFDAPASLSDTHHWMSGVGSQCWRAPRARGARSPEYNDAATGAAGYSNGISRALNNAATGALIAAAADGKELVDNASAKRAVAELTRESGLRCS